MRKREREIEAGRERGMKRGEEGERLRQTERERYVTVVFIIGGFWARLEDMVCRCVKGLCIV